MRKQNDKQTSRRSFLKLASAAGAGALGTVFAPAIFGRRRIDQKMKEFLVYIGTYTSGKTPSEGIYVYRFDAAAGKLSPHRTIAGVVEPSFLAIDHERRRLFAVNETVDYEGRQSGAVSAFAIDAKTGDLRFLNRRPSLGGAPCHLSVTGDGRFVLVANYVGGNVAVLPVETDGRLGASIDLEQHAGTGPNRERQEAAHAHSVMLDRRGRFAFVNDLGVDKIMIYRFDDRTGKLELNPAQNFYSTKAGAGPRHFRFHPNGKLAFVINELDQTISSLAYDERQGTLREIQTVATVPADFSGANTCADLHLSPDGKFVYGSNRGHDSIVGYRVDQKSGRLELVGHTATGGKKPRNFALSPDGRFLLAANQDSDSIVVFGRDERSGKLAATGHAATVPVPVCLLFAPYAGA